LLCAGGHQLGVNGKATDGFYSDEAARLALEAARRPQQPAAPALKAVEQPPKLAEAAPPAYVPPILLDEPQRPPLSPEPALNQNSRRERAEPILDAPARPARPLRRAEIYLGDDDAGDDRHVSIARVIAWVILGPWGLAMLAASLAILALFARNLVGL
jgi:hypothetical protein